MPSLAQLLRRLRRHAVPGRAQPAAVPVDRTAEMREELAPVFALLEPVVEATSAQLELAARQAEQLLAEATARSRQAAEDAERRYPGETAAEMARELSRLDREAHRAAVRAEAESAADGEALRARVQALSSRMVDFALALPYQQAAAGADHDRPAAQNGA